MNAAFSVWETRIAPVLDAAPALAVVSSSGDRPPARVTLDGPTPAALLDALLARHVSVLVCGAVSRSLQNVVETRGVTVFPFIAGELSEVMEAWREGRLDEERYRMPGCGRAAETPAGAGRRRLRRGEGWRRADAPYGVFPFPGERGVFRCPCCGLEIVNAPDPARSRFRCPNCRTWMVRA